MVDFVDMAFLLTLFNISSDDYNLGDKDLFLLIIHFMTSGLFNDATKIYRTGYYT